MIKIHSYGTEYKLRISIGKYAQNGRIALNFVYLDEEFGPDVWLPYANCTVNLDQDPGEGCAWLDTNNFPQVEDIFEKYNLGEETERMASSGFCFYPSYKLNMDEIKKYEY